MRYDFYAYMDRMKYIKRWQLMRSVREENVMEHSQCVAIIAHALASIHNEVFGGKADVLKTVLYAIYHETSEVLTGDLPTPIKYYNRSIHGAYKELEKTACERIVGTLPEELQGAYKPVLSCDDPEVEAIVKAADKISAWSHCLEDLKLGNREFDQAAVKIRESIDAIALPEVQEFMRLFAPSFSMTLDELGGVQ